MQTQREKNLEMMSAVTGRDSALLARSLGKGAAVGYDDNFPLRAAVFLGYADIARQLLAAGADVHADSEAPLHIAVQARDKAMIDVLVDAGADADAVLEKNRDKLDAESLKILSDIKTRDASAAFARSAAQIKKKLGPRRRLKPGPTP